MRPWSRPNIVFTLEYIRYPIGQAFEILQSDISKVANVHELQMVAKRWQFAERRFKTDMAMLPVPLYQYAGGYSKYEEYRKYLRKAGELIDKTKQGLAKPKR